MRRQRFTGLIVGLLVSAIAIYGFGHNGVETLVVRSQGAPPLILYVHVLLALGWLALFVVQSALVGIGAASLHRRLGLWGLGLGTALCLVSFATVLVMRRHDVDLHGPGEHRLSYLAITLYSCISFTVPFALGALWRMRSDYHRRLMIFATLTLLNTALAQLPGMIGGRFPRGLMILTAIMVAIAAVDWAQTRRLHPVYAWGIPLFLLLDRASALLTNREPALWLAICRGLIGLG